jgi:hypothetical protein
MKTLLLGAALSVLATASHAEERELWFRAAEKRALAQQIKGLGFSCPALHKAFFVGQQADGNHIRAVCGSTSQASSGAATFLLVAGGSGVKRIEPWEGRLSLLDGSSLRNSLD